MQDFVSECSQAGIFVCSEQFMRRQIDTEVRRIVHAEFAAEKFLERCPVFQHQNTRRAPLPSRPCSCKTSWSLCAVGHKSSSSVAAPKRRGASRQDNQFRVMSTHAYQWPFLFNRTNESSVRHALRFNEIRDRRRGGAHRCNSRVEIFP